MFNFNGISAKDIPWLRVKDIQGSVLPPLRRRYVTVPGKEGAYHAGRDVGIRREVITVKVNGDSLEGLMEKRRFLADWLDTEETVPFFYDHEPTKVYRAVLSEETNLDQVIYYGEVDLIFEMPDPYAESVEKKTALLQGRSADARYEDFTGVGTGTDIVADASGLRLAKEGQDYSNLVNTSWESGTHNGTEEVGNEYLQLAKSGTDYDKTWDTREEWEDPANTRINTGSDDDDLDLINLPEWDFIDHFYDYTINWRLTGSGGQVIQNDGYVTISGSVSSSYGIDIQNDPNIVVRFPATVILKYRNRGPDAARFIIEAGNGEGYIIELDDTSGEWVYLWITIESGTATLYKNGELVGTIASTGQSSVNQLQLYIPGGRNADFDVDFLYVDWDYNKGAPPADGWWMGTWETPYIDLSSVGFVKDATIGWHYEYTHPDQEAANLEDSGISIEYQLRQNGVEQGWVTLFNDATQEGDLAFPIADLPKGADLTGIEIKLRVTLRTKDPTNWPHLEYLRLLVTSGYHTYGYRDSVTITGVRQVGKAARSGVTWAVNSLPAGTSVKVYVRHRLNSADPWGDWVEVANSGDPFPGIDPTTDLSTAEIQYRVELITTDVAVTPSVDWLRLEFLAAYKPTGQWLSPPISLAPANVVGDSSISWTWNGIQDVQLEARVNGGAWQPVENGGEIPGVRGTEGAVVEVRLTLSTADTSETPVIDYLEVTAKEAIDSFIEYGGTAPGYPVFYIDVIDELDSLQILHVESGRFVLLEGNFQPGDAIVIDHNDQSITLNGVYRLDLLNIKSRLFRLQKGINSFDVEPEYGAIISMEWMERWK